MQSRTPEEAVDVLRTGGHRITAARAAIVGAVLTAGSPVSAQEVSAALAASKVPANVTTVYRELEFLRENGVVVPVSFADGVQRYESADLGHHHHLVCVECERIQDVEVPHAELHEAEKRIAATKKFTVLRHALEFYGTCDRCA
jgi:Fur family ferric uptake transcriptional regulator